MSDTISSPLHRWKIVNLAVTYGLFALLSMTLNLGTQQIMVMLLTDRIAFALYLSIAAGTIAGFVSKYMLDKYFIFFDRSKNKLDETRKVAFYGFFSIFTTAFFWAAEIASYKLFGTVTAKYTGAVIGLLIGYTAKFMLDRRFTFTGARR